MKPETFTPFDPAELLDDEETVGHYLALVIEGGDPDELVSALGTVARARGMTQLARDSGLGRESLYRSLSAGTKPRLDTFLKLLGGLGYGLSLRRLDTPKSQDPQKKAA